METEIYTIPTRRPRTRGEIRQRRKMRRLMIVSDLLVVAALVVGIVIGSQFASAYTQAPTPAPAPAPSPTEQIAGKLELPSAAVLYAIAAAEKIFPAGIVLQLPDATAEPVSDTAPPWKKVVG